MAAYVRRRSSAVDVRGADVAAALHAEIGIPEVVSDDEENVRPPGLSPRGVQSEPENGEEQHADTGKATDGNHGLYLANERV
jgi:hypothetical protein